MIFSKYGLTSKIGTTLKHMPQKMIQYMKRKIKNMVDWTGEPKHDLSLIITEDSIRFIKTNLAFKLKKSLAPAPIRSKEEQQIINRIQKQTKTSNQNNITRTAAYYEIYIAYPELHWAFLAHMVSRNGGWNMTDLKGALLPQLISAEQTEHLFLLLERANALIFQDAYPQLLIYIESLKSKQNLFHLLDEFHISAWMRPVWEYFWMHQNQSSALLTVALIINEQNYIEERVVQHPEYKKHVLDTLLFKMQGVLQLNQVLFPYVSQGNGQTSMKLAGLILEDFSDLHERIEFGKKLYSILFGFSDILQGARHFAKSTEHSGSRADYWPQLFTKTKISASTSSYSEKLKGSHLKKGALPFYSPELTRVWPNRPILPPDSGDWCKDLSTTAYLNKLEPPFIFDMTNEHCFGLNKIELAVLAKQK